MRTVWKYTIPPSPEVAARGILLDMPEGAKLLAVAEQFRQIALWYEVESDNPQETREFEITGTGHHVPDECSYVGTAHIAANLVIHVYERTTP